MYMYVHVLCGTHESFKTGRVVRVWPLKVSLSPNSGSQDWTDSPKSP